MGHGSSVHRSQGSTLQTTVNAVVKFKANARQHDSGESSGLDLTVSGKSKTVNIAENAESDKVIQNSKEKPRNIASKKKASNTEKKKTTGANSNKNTKNKVTGNASRVKKSSVAGETKIAAPAALKSPKAKPEERCALSEQIEKILYGAMDQKCPVTTKLIRIFISSTFTDTEHERNALMENVYPKLKSFCKAHGYGFQVVDMRWGVRDEVTDMHETTELCIREIRKCQQLSAGPNFITLLSDKYGYCPIPNKIEAQEFKTILAGVEDQSTMELFSKWYKEDLNAIPVSYILQPVSFWFPEYFANELNDFVKNKVHQECNSEFEQLKKSLMNAVQKVFPDEEKFRQYAQSVSEAEIKEGILNSSCDTSKYGWFRRQFTDLNLTSQPESPDILKYIDRTEEDENGVNIAQLQDNLKSELTKAVNAQNISVYSLKWTKNGIDPNSGEHKKYLEQYCNDFQAMLTRMITKSIEENKNTALESPLYQEVCQHVLFCQSKVEMFYGRKATLQRICEYVKSSSHTPLVLHGKSGCGKTSIIAKAAQLAQGWTKKKICIVLRFLGTTARSSSIRQLLNTILQQIKFMYNLDTKVPKGTKSLVQAFPSFLSSATKQKPLVVLLDSLDQLSPNGGGRQLSWLPRTLPDNVKIVVSTLPDVQYRCYPKLRAFFKDPKTFIEVPNLPESDVRDILTSWLKMKGRCLQPDQFKCIEEAFVQCPLPLFLKLSFDEACLWHSYMPPEQTRLQATIRDAINTLFERTERRHGELLVRYALGYVTAARSGLTTNELEDILSSNDEVLDDVFQYWEPPIRRLPPLIWVRIRADLDSYLVSRGAEGARVTNWYHRQFTEAAKARYLSDDLQRIRIHSDIGSYFIGQNVDDNAASNGGASTGKLIYSRLSSIASQPIKLSRNQYNLRKLHELPYHLIISKQWDVLKEKVLCNYEWLEAKIRARSLRDVLDDFHQAAEMYADQDIADVNELLELGKNAIVSDSRQLASQLVGRLYDKQVQDSSSLFSSPLSSTLTKLLEDAHSPEEPSLLPNRAFLTPPGGQLVRTLVGHKSGVHGLAISHDGNYLVSGSQDGSVKVWSMKDGQLMVSVTDLGEDVNTIKCCNEDKHIVTSSKRGLAVLDFDTGEILRSFNVKYFDLPPPFTLVGLNGTIAVTFTEKSLKSFDISNGNTTMNLTDIQPVGKAGQNSLLASYHNTVLCNSKKDENSLNVIDVKQSKVLRSFVIFDNDDDESFLNLTDIAMRQDDEIIVAKKMRVDLYDVLTGAKIKSIRCKLDDWISHMSILPETDQLAFPKRNSFSLLNLSTEERREVSEKSDSISRTVLAAEDVIVTSGGDNIVRVWDLTRKDARETGKPETLLHIYTVPNDPRHIITVGRLGMDNHVITAWDLSTFLPVCKVNNIQSNYIKIISDRRAALRVENQVAIIDLGAWKVLRFLKGKIPDFMIAGTPDLCVINEKREIVTYAFDYKRLKVYDIETGDETGEMVNSRCENTIQAFIVSQKGNVLALNDEKLDMIYIWDVINRQLLFHIQRDGYTSYTLTLAAFTPNDKMFVVALRKPDDCKHPSVWNLETKTLVHDLRYPKDTDTRSLAIIDDRMALTTHKDTANIVIWDLVNGIACHVLPSMHYGPRIDVASSGGRYALTHDGKSIVLWDIQEGKQLSSFTAEKITTVQPLFDGDVIAVGCESLLPLVVLRRQGRDLKPYQCPVEGTRAMTFPDMNVTLEGINQ